MMRYALVALTVLASGVATHLSAQSAGHATTAAKPTSVLVHGAWADASGWYDVTLALHVRGGAEADRWQRARRATHRRAGLEDRAVVVRRRDTGSRNQSGARALHGEADECARDRTARRASRVHLAGPGHRPDHREREPIACP